MIPFRDEMAALRGRVELLETALAERTCEACAARRLRRKRRPLARVVFAAAIGLGVLLVALFAVVAVSESLRRPF